MYRKLCILSLHYQYTDTILSLLLIANMTSLEIQVTGVLLPFATSAFSAHSLVSTVTVVQGVVACKTHVSHIRIKLLT